MGGGQKTISECVVDHFSKLFKKKKGKSRKLNLTNLKQIYLEERECIEANFEESKVKKAINNLGQDRAPGPNGFLMLFIKETLWGR